jgi:alkaline phosphatase
MKKLITSLFVITALIIISGIGLASTSYVPQQGDLIKTEGDSAIYYIDSLGEKHLFVNEVTFWSWHTGTWEDQNITIISQEDFDNLSVSENITVRPGASLIKFENSDKIFTVKSNKTIREISDIDIVLNIYGEDYNEILITIQNGFETDYTKGEAISSLEDEGLLEEDTIEDIEETVNRAEPGEEEEEVIEETTEEEVVEIDNRPDYTIDAIFQDMDLSNRFPNKSLNLRSQISNLGNSWSENGKVSITWYMARVFIDNQPLNWEKIAYTTINEFGNETSMLNATEDWTPRITQDYLFKAVIDEENNIDETNESNNEIEKWVTIRSSKTSTIANPDLKNIILFIGDGMGFEQVRAAGMYKTGTEGSLSFESFPYTGQVTTYSADDAITDSAAAGTAIATGQKVNNEVVSLATPGSGAELQTLLEYYKAQGKAVGLVTTTYMTHATPASFGAHESSRNSLSAIAQDYLTQTQPHVLLGGGGNGLDESSAVSAGYTVVDDQSSLLAIDTSSVSMLSGQFGTTHIPYEYNGVGDLPHLSDMTSVALNILDNDSDGFFVMIEGGRIDHAGHNNQIERLIGETLEFENSIDVAYSWASSRSDTLIIVTADHETGGLSIDTNNGVNNYPTVSWLGDAHTATNVPIYAWGKGAEEFIDTIDNTDIYGRIKQ